MRRVQLLSFLVVVAALGLPGAAAARDLVARRPTGVPAARAVAEVAGAASAAAAPVIKLRDTGLQASYAGILSDGGRLITSGSAPATGLQVLDVPTGRRVDVPLPVPCNYADLHLGRLLVDCPTRSGLSSGQVLDVATHAATPLPTLHGIPASLGPARYTGLGRQWLEVSVEADRSSTSTAYIHPGESAPFFGAAPVPGTSRPAQADLDLTSVLRPLCRGLELPTVPDEYPSFGAHLGHLDRVGSAATSLTLEDSRRPKGLARVELQRCGHPKELLATCPSMYPYADDCPPADLDDRFVGWTRLTRQGTRGYVRRIEGGRVLRLSPAGIGGVTFAGHRVCAVRKEHVLCSGPRAPLLPPVRSR